jgi:hypothetical protein
MLRAGRPGSSTPDAHAEDERAGIDIEVRADEPAVERFDFGFPLAVKGRLLAIGAEPEPIDVAADPADPFQADRAGGSGT